MALNWQWEDKMGEVIYKDGHKDDIFKGNAFMIGVHREDGYYNVTWFAVDEEHMKNMLGLKRGYENSMKNWGFDTLRLNLKYPSVHKIVTMFAKAKMPIKIELYEEV